MQCIIMENTLIKLTLHDETKKRAHDSQIVRDKVINHVERSYSCSGICYLIILLKCDMKFTYYGINIHT